MALEQGPECWEHWIDQARRSVLYAAEAYVYARRYRWATEEEWERLVEAIDTLAALNADYVANRLPSTGVATRIQKLPARTVGLTSHGTGR